MLPRSPGQRGRAGRVEGRGAEPPSAAPALRGLRRQLRRLRTRRGQTLFGGWLPLLQREARGAPILVSHPFLPRLLRKELSITSCFILMRTGGFPLFINLTNGYRDPVLFPSPASSRGPRSLLPSRVRDSPEGEGLHSSAGKGGTETPAAPGAQGSEERRPGRPGNLPPPARGGAPLLSRQRAVEGEGKVSLQILPGRASGHSPPRRKSVACSLSWKPGAERSKIREGAPQGCGTCSLEARGSLC